MRLLRIGLVALVAAPIATAASGGSGVRQAECLRQAPIGVRLPAALTIRTERGAFALRGDGLRCRISADSSPVPQNVGWWSSTGVWARNERGHLVVGRWHRTLWRSSGRFPGFEYEIGDLLASRTALAFSYGVRTRELYVARLGGREHAVARGEVPLGWTAGGGLFVRSQHGGAISLRIGGCNALLEQHVRTYAYAGVTHSLYVVDGDWLLRWDGSRDRPLADLRSLDLKAGRNLQIEPLGRLVALQEGYRLVVLRGDGSLFASTSLPRQPGGTPWLTGQPTAAANGAGVAFAAMRARTPSSNDPIERGVETVYLLRPGARSATPIHAERMRFNVCGHGADLSWHGRWLLYSTGGGNTALIDTKRGRAIELSSLVRRVPGFSRDGSGPLSVSWS